MPQIKPYEVQTNVSNLPEARQVRAEDFQAPARGLAELAQGGDALAKALQNRAEQQEISDLHVKFSQTMAESTAEYHKQLTDGTLDAEKFTEDFNKKIDALGDNIGTPKGTLYYRQGAASLKSDFLEKAALGQAQLAGMKAKADYENSLKYASSTLMADPSSFATSQRMQHSAIDAAVATNSLPYEQALKLKQQSDTELAKSAVRGWIRLSPDEAQTQLDQGKFDKYFDGDVKKQLYGEVTVAKDAQIREAHLLKQMQQEVIKEQQRETQNLFLDKLVSGKLTTREVLDSNLEPVGSGSKKEFLNMMTASSNAKARGISYDPALFNSLSRRIHLDDGDPNKITDENYFNKYVGRGLDISHANMLRKEFQGGNTIDGKIEAKMKKGVIDIARSQLVKANPLTGMTDPIGQKLLQEWTAGFYQRYQAQRAAGKSAQALTTPGSPDYLGNDIQNFKRSDTQIMQDLVKSNNRTPPPSKDLNQPAPQQPAVAPPSPDNRRRPGESTVDFLKRTRGH